jgi:hybrid cluster-associated redox disulfide protein
MRGTTPLSLDMTVDETLARWPALAEVLVRRRMACAGCAMAPFERLSDVARAYGVSSARLLQELRARLDRPLRGRRAARPRPVPLTLDGVGAGPVKCLA